VLPAWATVTVSAITALAAIFGSLGAVIVKARYDRTQDRERRREDAAADMATALHQSATAAQRAVEVGYAQLVNWSGIGLPDDLVSAIAEARRLNSEARAELGRVLLLYGQSPTSKAASTCATLLRRVLEALEQSDPQNAQDRWDDAYEHLWAFTDAARSASSA
jgi:hypothetical protein